MKMINVFLLTSWNKIFLSGGNTSNNFSWVEFKPTIITLDSIQILTGEMRASSAER